MADAVPAEKTYAIELTLKELTALYISVAHSKKGADGDTAYAIAVGDHAAAGAFREDAERYKSLAGKIREAMRAGQAEQEGGSTGSRAIFSDSGASKRKPSGV